MEEDGHLERGKAGGRWTVVQTPVGGEEGAWRQAAQQGDVRGRV